MEESKLSTEEIFSILVKKIGNSNFELINHEMIRPAEKIGLLGDHGILSTTVNIFTSKESQRKDLRSYSFFVKHFPSYELQAVFCKETGAFKKEVFMYNLFEQIRSCGIRYVDCVPRCYFSKTNYAIVTDNLCESGYRLLDKMDTLDYDTILVIIKSLSKLHCSSLIYEEKKSEELGRPYRILDDHENDLEETFYSDRKDFINIKGVQASLKGICSEIDIFQLPAKLESGKDFKTVLESEYHRIYDLVKRNSHCRNVLCHGDLHTTNFLIKFDNNNKPLDCKFVDFQYGRYLPPSHDVMALLHLTTSREFRKAHLYELLGIYYTDLEKYLKLAGININNIIPFQDFLNSCEQQKFLALFINASYHQLILVDNQKLQDFFSDTEGGEQTLSGDRTPLILDNIEHNEKYAERLKDSMLDLQEFCNYL